MCLCGLFTLPDMASDTDLESDSTPDGYIVLYRNCSHCTDSDSDSDSDPHQDPQLLLYPFLGRISVPGSGSGSVRISHYGLFTLPDSDSDSDSKPNGYIVLCRHFHIARSQIQIPILNANYRNGIAIRVRTRVHLLQSEWSIRPPTCASSVITVFE